MVAVGGGGGCLCGVCWSKGWFCECKGGFVSVKVVLCGRGGSFVVMVWGRSGFLGGSEVVWKVVMNKLNE